MSGPTPLWTAPELLAATGGSASGGVGDVTGVSIDTRTLEAGDLFVALRGPARDGHDFVEAALAKGAAACLVERGRSASGPSMRLIEVADPMAGLNALGRNARARSAAHIAAITGSVGKTSSKEMLALALAGQGSVHASAASYNNHWGVPLSLARMDRTAAWGIFEIGMNHAGEITPLTILVRPHVAVITAVEAAHLEFFSGLDAIADAKAEIFLGLAQDGIAIVPADGPQTGRLRAAARRLGITDVRTFGSDGAADIALVGFEPTPDGAMITADVRGLRQRYRLGVPGRHMAMNSLAVLAAGDALGADVAMAAEALAGFAGVSGRGRREPVRVAGGAIILIDESYNASPASVRAALAVLGAGEPGPGGRRIAILGDMRELGPAGPALHAALADEIAGVGLDLLLTCGPLMRHLHEARPAGIEAAWCPDAQTLAPLAAAAVRPGDLVMVKGSLGSRMALVVTALRAGAAPSEAPPSC